jgi:hypothetical protein
MLRNGWNDRLDTKASEAATKTQIPNIVAGSRGRGPTTSREVSRLKRRFQLRPRESRSHSAAPAPGPSR